MDGRRHLARSAAHAAVGDQCHFETLTLQDRQRRRELVQLGHAIGLRTLPAHHANHVARQLTRLEGLVQRLLRIKDTGRCFDHMTVFRHSRDLDHTAAQIALQQLESAGRTERCIHRAQHAQVFGRPALVPNNVARLHERLAGVFAQALAANRQHVFVHETGIEQLADHKAGAAHTLELVDVGAAVGVNMAQQRHHLRKRRKVIPVNGDAGRAGHGNPVNQVVGRAAGGQQRNHGVDDGALVHDAADGRIAFAQCDAQHGACGFACQLVAQIVAGVYKGGAGHMQAHGFEQHLVAVGRAVKGAGAGAVVRLELGFQQLVTAHQPLRGFFANGGFLFV